MQRSTLSAVTHHKEILRPDAPFATVGYICVDCCIATMVAVVFDVEGVEIAMAD
jgi:hypothetical protein